MRSSSRLLALALLLVITLAAEPVGSYRSGRDEHGVYYALEIPKDWNGSLVVYAHGGPDFSAEPGPPQDAPEWLLDQGYAWAASSYRRGGYGVRQAAADTENVRRVFTDRFGSPRRTYLFGQSWGGNVAAKAAEVYPGSWDGVLLTDGVVAGGSRAYLRRVTLWVVYRYYCRDLPLDTCTGRPGERDELQQRTLNDILAVTGLPEQTLSVHLEYANFLFDDLVGRQLGGRNPFTNQGVRYTGSHDDAALNAGVERFSADPAAARALAYDSDLTGEVAVPVLTLHALGDPQVLVEQEDLYRAGFRGPGLVQTFTTETTHGVSASEYRTSLAALDRWVRTGRKPTPASIAASCTGECYYRVSP